MLTAQEQMELEILKKPGASIRELAKATGHSRNTVGRYLRGGEAAAVRKAASKRSASQELDDTADDPLVVDALGTSETYWQIWVDPRLLLVVQPEQATAHAVPPKELSGVGEAWM